MTTAELQEGAVIRSDIAELMDRTGPDADGRYRLRLPMGDASLKVELDIEPEAVQETRDWCERAGEVVRTIQAADTKKLLDVGEPEALYAVWLGRGFNIGINGGDMEVTNLDSACSDVAEWLRSYAARLTAVADRIEALQS